MRSFIPRSVSKDSAAAVPVDASQFSRLSSSFGLYLMDGSGEPSQDFRSDTMDKKKLEGFKKRLETRQQELRRTVSRTQADGRSADEDTAQDIADRAASSYTKEFLFSQSNNERQLLQMVDKALARIREGSFGECIHCGKEINAKRLEAVPWTRHCIECQEKLEQGLLEETSH
jgi:DnaK suppressor protein